MRGKPANDRRAGRCLDRRKYYKLALMTSLFVGKVIFIYAYTSIYISSHYSEMQVLLCGIIMMPSWRFIVEPAANPS